MEIKDMLMADETLFRNEEVFDFSYVPETFSHRNGQLQALANCLKPALRGSKPLNAVLFGNPATGKTTAVRTVFNQLEESTDKIIAVHVNCQLHSSQFRIISEIHKKLFGFLPPETGVPLSNIYDKVFTKLAKSKKILIVALDDISGNDSIIYDILRAHESYPGVKTGVFAVMQRDETYKLSDKVRSVFQPNAIEFPLYNRKEIYDILKKRAEIGLYANVISKELLDRISDLTHEKSDLRFGIELMKQSALKAESDTSLKIEKNHLDAALNSLDKKVKGIESQGPESMILSLLKKDMTSGNLYDALKKKTGMSYTSFYRLLKKMESSGLVKTETKLLKKGKTRIIRRK